MHDLQRHGEIVLRNDHYSRQNLKIWARSSIEVLTTLAKSCIANSFLISFRIFSLLIRIDSRFFFITRPGYSYIVKIAVLFLNARGK